MRDVSSVFVVDDDEAVLLSVKALLQRQGYDVQCYESADRFLGEQLLSQPGCLVTDVRMPGMDGIELQEKLLSEKSPLSVVVVTGVADVPSTVHIMKNGAVTLLQKPYQPGELVAAVKQGLESSMVRWRQQRIQLDIIERLKLLTDDEKGVMQCMLQGQPNKQIIHELTMSARTVDRRRRSVLEKMGTGSVAELASLLRFHEEYLNPADVSHHEA